MKLSQLIAFRNRLDELPVGDIKKLAQNKLDVVMHLITNEISVDSITQPFVEQLSLSQRDIYNMFDRFDNELDRVKKTIHNQIVEQEKHWFQESYRLFELAELCETTDQILHGRTVAGDKSEQTLLAENTLRARLTAYADWRFPGMIIRPGMEDFVETMVGCDPLYIVDRDHDLLQPCLDRFPKLYQNRLRPYTTNDWGHGPILERIPDNQFGICLAYKVFDYRPLEIIRQYLQEIYQKLRPGGGLLMTFNDCDNDKAVMLVEQFCASYTPGYLIRDLTQNVGFELVYTWSDGGPSVWLELRKPGELVSKRGGQVISIVNQIGNYLQDVDFLRRKVYNEQDIVLLKESATALDIEQDIIDGLCTTCPYDLQILIDNKRNELEEKEKLNRLRQLAEQYNIDVENSDWKELLTNAQNKALALEHGVDINLPNWKEILETTLIKKQEERARQDEEDRRIAAKAEKKRIKLLHQQARLYNINPTLYDKEEEIHSLIAEAVDQRKKDELKQLRQQAMELQVGDPNLIRYGYSAEKLKQLIKAKEEGQ